MDYSLLGSSVHGILQARVLQWVSISFSRGSSRPRDQTRVSCTVGRCFTILSHQGSLVEAGASSKSLESTSWLVCLWTDNGPYFFFCVQRRPGGGQLVSWWDRWESTLESAGAPELLLYLVIQWTQRFLITETLLWAFQPRVECSSRRQHPVKARVLSRGCCNK